MCLVGMLHHRKHPSDVKKAYPFAAVAKMEGIHFIYFSYGGINFSQRRISGWVYEKGTWLQKQTRFPDVIINSSNPRTKKQLEITRRLKESTIFTSHSVGTKMKVYRKVLRGKTFSTYLIPSIHIKNAKQVLEYVNNHPKAVMKPFSGNHGKKIVFLHKEKDCFRLVEGTQSIILKETEVIEYLEQRLNEQKYLLQPFIDCRTKAGLVYDLRLHIQKNGRGEWDVTLIYPRISGDQKMITNISSGGYRGELEPFLEEEFGGDASRIRQKLEKFALSFGGHFDSLYTHSFDELGIDVGLDQQQKIWIFEVNWRPGSKHREFDVARRLIPYCRYLANRS